MTLHMLLFLFCVILAFLICRFQAHNYVACLVDLTAGGHTAAAQLLSASGNLCLICYIMIYLSLKIPFIYACFICVSVMYRFDLPIKPIKLLCSRRLPGVYITLTTK